MSHPHGPDKYNEYPLTQRIEGVRVTVQIEVPVQLTVEAILEGERARGEHNERLRLTCKEFLGRGVPTLPPLPKEGHAFCTDCGEEKPFMDFTADGRKSNGRHSECKKCAAAKTKHRRMLKVMALDRMVAVRRVAMTEIK